MSYPLPVSASTWHFARHYVEMVVAMLLGMAVLWLPAGWVLGTLGDAPAVMLLGMAATMTVPMVGWMRYRGHGWRVCNEMSATMFVPTFAAIALLWSGLVEDVGVLMAIEHTAMFVGMFVAMLVRHAEYTPVAA
jgi:hypothetical protein